MECKDAKELFIGYQDGDLDPKTKKAFEAHLESCPECKKEWEDYKKTLEEVSGLYHLAPSDDFVSKVKQTIDKRSKGRFFGASTATGTNFAVISFILIMLFLLAYLFFTTGVEVEVVPKEETDTSTDLEDEI